MKIKTFFIACYNTYQLFIFTHSFIRVTWCYLLYETPKWTPIGPTMDPKWTQNGPHMDSEWTPYEPRMDPEWTQNGLRMDPNVHPNEPQMDHK